MTSVAAGSQRESQWALIWREFRKRRLAVACLGVIVFLMSVSILAPFLAHDRPLFYRGINRFEFKESLRTIRELLSRFSDPKMAGDEARQEIQRALKLHAGLIDRALPPDLATRWQNLMSEVQEAVSQSAGGDQKLQQIRRTIQTEFARRDITLVSVSQYPVLASLTWLDVLFMTGLLVAALAWGLFTLSRWRRRPAFPYGSARTALLAGLLLPVLCAAGWWWLVPYRVDRTNYKAAVLASDPRASSADVVMEQALWPLIPYGIDEDDLANKQAPPAWSRSEKGSEKETDATESPAPRTYPAWTAPHWLGTDTLGRDVLCRMIWGGRVSLSVGIVSVVIYVAIGIVVGAIAGYFRGIWDLIISRIIEVVICFPAFFLILTIVAFVGPSILNIMIVIGLTGWTGIARLVRSEFLRLVDQEFVLAGRALGYSPLRLIFRHILPNAMAPVTVSATFGIAGAILTESALSFLGLGITPPASSWGEMLSSGRNVIFIAPWLIWYPGLAIFVTISCYNLIGEALRDASDPRLRGSR